MNSATPAATSTNTTPTCPPDADGTQYTYDAATGMCNPVTAGGRRRKGSRKGSRKGRKGSRKGSRKQRKERKSRKQRKGSRKGSRRN